MKQRIQRLLEHRYSPLVIVVLSVALLAGSINNGLLLDDHIQKLMLSDDSTLPWTQKPPWDQYRLISSDPDFVAHAKQQGINPWWGGEDYQATFFRPISSLALYLDHLLWPKSPVMAHLHSLLWFGFMGGAALLVFRKYFSSRLLFALAAGLYILDDAHVFPATWIANRNSLVATTFALLVLLFHYKWQKEHWRPGAVAAPLMLLVALFAGEFALGICGFLLAHALFLDEGTLTKRLLRLTPYGVVVVGWRVVYVTMGYGVWGSDLYVDPLHSPGLFLKVLLERLPILIQAGAGLPGAEASMLLSHYQWILTLVSILLISLYYAAIRPLLGQNPKVKFFLVGAVLSLVPVCATFPHDRLLLIAGIGIFGAMAIFLESFFRSVPWWETGVNTHRLWPPIAKGMAVFWLVTHGVLSPVSTPVKAEITQVLGGICNEATASLPNDLNGKTIVIVAAPDLFASTFVPLWRSGLGLSVPQSTIALYNGVEELTVIRETAQSLVFEVPTGQLGMWTDQLVRHIAEPFFVGQVIHRANTRFQVLKTTQDGNPTRVRATFNRSLDDDRVSFWVWAGKRYVPFQVPSLGEKHVVRVNIFAFLLE